ncbi:acyl-ACP desaturase [Deinococcus maricopensis]|uniref:Fatty acid desaturase type 2 n=1 Tax=Deinococcus maricopensis (strain DSM 21211 / LMG 22137 / NRRL B-23946 / LB-34) TaxID=709986 RepID=E8U8C0_DEIML|nr:acyl-ACP desaturase [Deinococcus maricopensis]ADV67309.1 fatty acid desaturase type 2 [Deinococcus maricopensis DSM 21211]
MSAIIPPNVLGDIPRTPAGLLSNREKDRLIERAFLGLYRWYTARSQETRNWNADKSFDWRAMNHDLPGEIITVVQGFFAVEQYAPDYTSSLVNLVRRSHGRSHFQMRWGSEEEKHADAWENAVLFSRQRSPEWIAEYKERLKSKQWELPFPDAIHNLVYTVFQERATQLNYLNLMKIAQGKSDKPHLKDVRDPVLAKVAQTIAVDEAAHYNFFLEGVRLYLYYYPQQTLQAIKNVIAQFSMPAATLVPNWEEFFETVYRAGIYGPRDFSRDVMQVAFRNLGIESRKKLEEGIKATREVPDFEDDSRVQTIIWDTFDYGSVEGDVRRLHVKIQDYENEIGFSELDPTEFIENPEVPRTAQE